MLGRAGWLAVSGRIASDSSCETEIVVCLITWEASFVNWGSPGPMKNLSCYIKDARQRLEVDDIYSVHLQSSAGFHHISSIARPKG